MLISCRKRMFTIRLYLIFKMEMQKLGDALLYIAWRFVYWSCGLASVDFFFDYHILSSLSLLTSPSSHLHYDTSTSATIICPSAPITVITWQVLLRSCHLWYHAIFGTITLCSPSLGAYSYFCHCDIMLCCYLN